MNEEAAQPQNSRLSPRILTALVGIPIVLAIVHFGGWLLYLTVFALAFFSSLELRNATQTSSTRVDGLAAALLLFLFPALYDSLAVEKSLKGFFVQLPFIQHLFFFVIVSLVVTVRFYNTRHSLTLNTLALTVFATLYLLLFAFIPILQSLPNGHALLWLTLFCVWAGDTLAYFGGRRFGRTKLTPLSPGKSREGAAIGFVASIFVGALVGYFSAIGLVHGIALGALVGVFAPLGDLAESFWKRELGVKDLGTILPGHGGVLDRCDSLLFAAPAAYFYAKWFLN